MSRDRSGFAVPRRPIWNDHALRAEFRATLRTGRQDRRHWGERCSEPRQANGRQADRSRWRLRRGDGASAPADAQGRSRAQPSLALGQRIGRGSRHRRSFLVRAARWRARARRPRACAARSSATSASPMPISSCSGRSSSPMSSPCSIAQRSMAAQSEDIVPNKQDFYFREVDGVGDIEATGRFRRERAAEARRRSRAGTRGAAAHRSGRRQGSRARQGRARREHDGVRHIRTDRAQPSARARHARRACAPACRIVAGPDAPASRRECGRPCAPQPARLPRRQSARRSRAHHAAGRAADGARPEAQGVPFAGATRRRSNRIAARRCRRPTGNA